MKQSVLDMVEIVFDETSTQQEKEMAASTIVEAILPKVLESHVVLQRLDYLINDEDLLVDKQGESLWGASIGAMYEAKGSSVRETLVNLVGEFGDV